MGSLASINKGNGTLPFQRNQGVTPAERLLASFCDRAFLTLWSYPSPYRDENKTGNGHGKELCDLLVVFQDHIIIFSDKDCQFPDTGDLQLDWSRWFRRAVLDGAKQLWGAEKWLKENPGRVFLDRACSRPLPVELPDMSTAKIHRIVVAHGAAERCKRELGGSGSLMIYPDVHGNMHVTQQDAACKPFTIGHIDVDKGYVHILDDTTLDIVLGQLDTITDFVEYLTKKETFIASGRLAFAAGEEELLAYYLTHFNEQKVCDFTVPKGSDMIFVPEELWEDFATGPQREAQKEADNISYAWDLLIEKFSKHILEGTSYYSTQDGRTNLDVIMRWLARESRTRRRMLASGLFELMEKTGPSIRAARVIMPSRPGDPYYVFFLIPPHEEIPYAESYEQYREVRRKFLEAYCMAIKVKYPDAEDIVGLAMESGFAPELSEDSLYLDARNWSADDQVDAVEVRQQLGLLENVQFFRDTVYDYPLKLDNNGTPDPSYRAKPGPNPRNKPCPCGSGRKYKRCCGR